MMIRSARAYANDDKDSDTNENFSHAQFQMFTSQQGTSKGVDYWYVVSNSRGRTI